MISIGKEVRQAEQRAHEREEVLSFYISALQLSAKHALDTPGREAYVLTLTRLCEEIAKDSSLPGLHKTLLEFERCLADYSASLEGSIGQGLSGSAQEIRTILALLKQAVGSMDSSNERIGIEVREFTSQLEQSLDCNDLTSLRKQVSDQVDRMKEWGDSLRQESSVQLASLEKQLRTYEERLREVESTVATDPLTGVWNRREADRCLLEWINHGTPFSVIVIDLNRFKAVNDQYGHRCGDRVLRYVADRLQSAVRTRDRVCRWGGDEFVVLMELERAVGERRAHELAEQLHGFVCFEFDGQHLKLELSASVGWAAYEPGDTPASLFHRADQDMYEKKRLAKLQPPKTPIFAF